jgi:hypothetical protein
MGHSYMTYMTAQSAREPPRPGTRRSSPGLGKERQYLKPTSPRNLAGKVFPGASFGYCSPQVALHAGRVRYSAVRSTSKIQYGRCHLL